MAMVASVLPLLQGGAALYSQTFVHPPGAKAKSQAHCPIWQKAHPDVVHPQLSVPA